ncbi:MAG: hypothetical protein R3F60_02870 [bacterium]
MVMRISPYLLSLIDWQNPEGDPLRIQFLPMGTKFLPDHRSCGSRLAARAGRAPVPG